jgi:hypothetical protein
MWFAECFFRALGKEALCRVLNKKHSAKKILGKEAALPSAMWFAECFFWALGKEALCRVLNKKHSAKKNTRQRSCFAECKKNTRQRHSLPSAKKTLGKEAALPSAKKTLGKEGLCRVFFFALGKAVFKTHFEALNEFKFKSF